MKLSIGLIDEQGNELDFAGYARQVPAGKIVKWEIPVEYVEPAFTYPAFFARAFGQSVDPVLRFWTLAGYRIFDERGDHIDVGARGGVKTLTGPTTLELQIDAPWQNQEHLEWLRERLT